MKKLDIDIDADIIEKVHKLKTRGYKGFKAV
jgi:hypothetical protein